jgi:glycosyltransferase involved in cell wall biosynthesis
MYCSQFHPIIGGAERQAERLASVLVQMGVEIAVVTPRLNAESPLEDEIGGVPVRRFDVADLVADLPVRIRGLGLVNTWIRRRQIGRAIRSAVDGFDLLHIHLASHEACFAMQAAQRAGKPTLCKIACGGASFDFREMERSSVLAPLFRKRMVEHMHHWIAISHEIHQDLVEAGVPASRIVPIPNGKEPEAFSPPQTPDGPRNFLYLGRLRKCDVETLVAGFDLHLRSYPESRLRISGTGDASAALEAVSRHPAATSRIEVTGPVASGEAYAWAHALVHPTRAEGVSNSLLEAMSRGIPCLASDIPPNRELLDEGRAGLLFRLGRPKELAAALDALACDPEAGRRLASDARKRIDEKYDMRVVAAQYEALYRRILGTAPGDDAR